jgi:hypothetical protein
MSGAWKAVEQEQFRGIRCPRLTIEDVEAVYVSVAVPDDGHGVLL